MKITVIGAGLAGCEAAYQITRFGIDVDLVEMKPKKLTPAHKDINFAELVCSNSLKSNRKESACGLLKEEMRVIGSLCMDVADESKIPAGNALAVDRDSFSQIITKKIKDNPRINIIEKEMTDIPEDETVIIATGPLTTDGLIKSIADLTSSERLYFYDASAPIIFSDSIDMDKVFKGSRYGKGGDDYINCPMDEIQFNVFAKALIEAETAEIKDFEKKKIFESCMPIELIASRGVKTLTFGPMKPVGFINPKTGKRPFAVVQLRQDDYAAELYSPVGFQTRLKINEQKRVIRTIPGLEHAEFARFGVMHRNSFINSPDILDKTFMMKKRPGVYFAGQISGVEGYVESMASGMIAGIYACLRAKGIDPLPEMTNSTMNGALAEYISNSNNKNFQPMNANFGIIKPIETSRKISKAEKYSILSSYAIKEINKFYINLKKYLI